jgi:hypothetical protein
MSALVFRLLRGPLPRLADSKRRSARAIDRHKTTKRPRHIPQLEPLEYRYTPDTVTFSTSGSGVSAAIPYWGLILIFTPVPENSERIRYSRSLAESLTFGSQ